MDPEQLPTGPYSVRWGRVLVGAMGMSALGVLVGAMGVLCLYFSGVWALDLWESETVWAAAEIEVPDDRIAFSGEVETTNLIFNDYDLSVEWVHPEGSVHRFEVEMMTFFTGPDSDTPMVVRAMADDPSRATTSWQHDARWHGVGWIVLMIGIGGLMGGSGVMVLVATVNDIRKTSMLSRDGRLCVVPVAIGNVTNNNGTVTVALTVQVDGREHALSYVKDKADPLYVGENHVVVLAGEGEVLLPREDGYPLDLPALAL